MHGNWREIQDCSWWTKMATRHIGEAAKLSAAVSPPTKARITEAAKLSEHAVNSGSTVDVNATTSKSAVEQRQHLKDESTIEAEQGTTEEEDNVKHRVVDAAQPGQGITLHQEQVKEDTVQPKQDTEQDAIKLKQGTSQHEQNTVKLKQDASWLEHDTKQDILMESKQDTVQHAMQRDQDTMEDTVLLEQQTVHDPIKHDQNDMEHEQNVVQHSQKGIEPEPDFVLHVRTCELKRDPVYSMRGFTQHIPETVIEPTQLQLVKYVYRPWDLRNWTNLRPSKEPFHQVSSDNITDTGEVCGSEGKTEESMERGDGRLRPVDDGSLDIGETVRASTVEATQDEEMTPPSKKLKLSHSTEKVNFQGSTLTQMLDKAVQIPSDEESADDGYDTVFQALPSECARQHALVPNVPPCWTQRNQFDPNNKDDPPDDEGLGGSQRLVVEPPRLGIPSYTLPPMKMDVDTEMQYTTASPDFENQLVPEDTWQHYCNSQSLYTDMREKNAATLDLGEKSEMGMPMDFSPSSTDMLDCGEQRVDPPNVPTTYSSCFQESKLQQRQALPGGLGNLGKPRLRIGLSRRQKCRSLHDNSY